MRTCSKSVRAYSPDADLELLRRAYVFSAFEHRGQVRRSGEPYLIHPLAVADFLVDLRLDVVAISAGLLHDVVEDTLTTIERIRELFGPDVAHVVEGVTKISAIPFSSTEERQAENFRKMLLAMVDDIRVILVKLADRVHNMRTLSHLPEDRRQRVAQETRDIYAPIANRLGMSKVKNELEELAFKYLEPQAYEGLRIKVDLKRRAAEGLIQSLKATIEAKLREAQIPSYTSTAASSACGASPEAEAAEDRARSGLRLHRAPYRDRQRQGLLRRARHHPPDVVARARTHQGLRRDAPAERLSVVAHVGDQRTREPFEVQIRTVEMHRMAEEGIAAHWKYKEGRVGDQRDERYFQWMRQLLEYQQEVRDPQEFIQNLKVELYPEEVYTFTPKGAGEGVSARRDADRFRVRDPHGRGPSVRRRAHQRQDGAAPHPAANGDIVEIVTPSGHKPSRDWLNFVVTSHARYKIKHLIRREERVRAIDSGARCSKKRRGATTSTSRRCSRARRSRKVARRSRRRRPPRICSRTIGYGKLSREAVARQAGARRSAAARKPPDGAVAAAVKRAFGTGEEKIKVRGIDDVMVFRARCCNPIRGEKIVGYITRGKGVSVHSATCPNVVNLLYDPERRIDVEWDKARRRATAPLHGEADDGSRGPEGLARRRQREDRRHQHQHPQHGSAHRRRSPRPHRRHRRDQRLQAPRTRDEVVARRGRRAGRRSAGSAGRAG